MTRKISFFQLSKVVSPAVRVVAAVLVWRTPQDSHLRAAEKDVLVPGLPAWHRYKFFFIAPPSFIKVNFAFSKTKTFLSNFNNKCI